MKIFSKMNKETKKVINMFSWIVWVISMFLLWSVSWKVAIGVLMFGWAMNIENNG